MALTSGSLQLLYGSTPPNDRAERLWLLRTLAGSVALAEDYQLLRRCGVVDAVLGWWEHPSCDAASQSLLLRSLACWLRVPEAGLDLTMRRALFSWILRRIDEGRASDLVSLALAAMHALLRAPPHGDAAQPADGVIIEAVAVGLRLASSVGHSGDSFRRLVDAIAGLLPRLSAHDLGAQLAVRSVVALAGLEQADVAALLRCLLAVPAARVDLYDERSVCEAVDWLLSQLQIAPALLDSTDDGDVRLLDWLTATAPCWAKRRALAARARRVDLLLTAHADLSAGACSALDRLLAALSTLDS